MKTKRSKPADGDKMTAAVAPTTKPKLNQAQQLVCDEVAQLLLHGGRKEDLDGLLKVTLNSALWRLVNLHTSGPEKLGELARLSGQYLPAYRASIIAEWDRNKQAPGAERPSPSQPVIASGPTFWGMCAAPWRTSS